MVRDAAPVANLAASLIRLLIVLRTPAKK